MKTITNSKINRLIAKYIIEILVVELLVGISYIGTCYNETKPKIVEEPQVQLNENKDNSERDTLAISVNR